MSPPNGADHAAERGAPEASHGHWLMVAIAWLLVCAPLAWGVWTTLKKAAILFR